MNEKVCRECGAVVLDTQLHDSFHVRVGGAPSGYLTMPQVPMKPAGPAVYATPNTTPNTTFDMAEFRRVFGVKVSETPDHFESIGEVDDFLGKLD